MEWIKNPATGNYEWWNPRTGKFTGQTNPASPAGLDLDNVPLYPKALDTPAGQTAAEIAAPLPQTNVESVVYEPKNPTNTIDTDTPADVEAPTDWGKVGSMLQGGGAILGAAVSGYGAYMKAKAAKELLKQRKKEWSTEQARRRALSDTFAQSQGATAGFNAPTAPAPTPAP